MRCPYCDRDTGLSAMAFHLKLSHPAAHRDGNYFVCACGMRMDADGMGEFHVRHCPAFELLRLEAALSPTPIDPLR